MCRDHDKTESIKCKKNNLFVIFIIFCLFLLCVLWIDAVDAQSYRSEIIQYLYVNFNNEMCNIFGCVLQQVSHAEKRLTNSRHNFRRNNGLLTIKKLRDF